MRRLLCLTVAPVVVAALVACDSNTKSADPSGSPGNTPSKVDPKAGGKGSVATTSPGRVGRRLSVDQVRRTVEYLFPGIRWTRGKSTTSEFTRLATTLGKADYITLVNNKNDASMLFMKNMVDMAGDVCRKAVDKDRSQPVESKRLFVRYQADVAKTLRWARLKFHAIHVPAGSTEGIAQYQTLYDNVLKGTRNDERRAWIGVCAAMLTAAEFLTY